MGRWRRMIRRQTPYFWLWVTLIVFMLATALMWAVHLATSAYLQPVELTSSSSLEDMRQTINRNSGLIVMLEGQVADLDGQHRWVLGLLIATLVGMVVELTKHYTRHDKEDT